MNTPLPGSLVTVNRGVVSLDDGFIVLEHPAFALVIAVSRMNVIGMMFGKIVVVQLKNVSLLN